MSVLSLEMEFSMMGNKRMDDLPRKLFDYVFEFRSSGVIGIDFERQSLIIYIDKQKTYLSNEVLKLVGVGSDILEYTMTNNARQFAMHSLKKQASWTHLNLC